jgi:hypothetical protein
VATTTPGGAARRMYLRRPAGLQPQARASPVGVRPAGPSPYLADAMFGGGMRALHLVPEDDYRPVREQGAAGARELGIVGFLATEDDVATLRAWRPATGV